MTLDELVITLRDQNVHLFDDGDAFRVQARKGVLTPQLLEVVTAHSAELLYLIRLGDVRVCPSRWEHRPSWRYSPTAKAFLCCDCRKETVPQKAEG
jgi:hypothetical protein